MFHNVRDQVGHLGKKNERLAAVPADLPNVHPNISIVYQRKVERHAEALAQSRDRDEAANP